MRTRFEYLPKLITELLQTHYVLKATSLQQNAAMISARKICISKRVFSSGFPGRDIYISSVEIHLKLRNLYINQKGPPVIAHNQESRGSSSRNRQENHRTNDAYYFPVLVLFCLRLFYFGVCLRFLRLGIKVGVVKS